MSRTVYREDRDGSVKRRRVWHCPVWLHVLGQVTAIMGVAFLMWALALMLGIALGSR